MKSHTRLAFQEKNKSLFSSFANPPKFLARFSQSKLLFSSMHFALCFGHPFRMIARAKAFKCGERQEKLIYSSWRAKLS